MAGGGTIPAATRDGGQAGDAAPGVDTPAVTGRARVNSVAAGAGQDSVAAHEFAPARA